MKTVLFCLFTFLTSFATAKETTIIATQVPTSSSATPQFNITISTEETLEASFTGHFSFSCNNWRPSASKMIIHKKSATDKTEVYAEIEISEEGLCKNLEKIPAMVATSKGELVMSTKIQEQGASPILKGQLQIAFADNAFGMPVFFYPTSLAL